MFQKIAKHRANDASNDVHRPPLLPRPTPNCFFSTPPRPEAKKGCPVHPCQRVIHVGVQIIQTIQAILFIRQMEMRTFALYTV